MNSEPGSWEVRVRKSAQKNLRRAPRHERERLIRALEEMSRDPFVGDIVRLQNQPVFFDVDSEQIASMFCTSNAGQLRLIAVAENDCNV
jgi:hypothetical protein